MTVVGIRDRKGGCAAPAHPPDCLFPLEGGNGKVPVDQYAVLGLEVAGCFPFCLQQDGEELAIAFEQEVVAPVDEGGIDSPVAIGVQAVAGEVHHFFHACCLHADVFKVTAVVGQGKAQGVDGLHAFA